MAKDDDRDSQEDGADRPQDPWVARLRPDPSEPPERVQVLEGLLGDSDRPGYRRLYFTSDLDRYAEFRAEDVLGMSEIASDQAPFLGETATRVTLRRDAVVDFTRSRSARPVDEFDLDIRLSGAGAASLQDNFETRLAECGGGLNTQFGCEPGSEVTICAGPITICRGGTCDTCRTDCQDTCGPTCRGATCRQTCADTCGPTCGPTCEPTCGPTCECTFPQGGCVTQFTCEPNGCELATFQGTCQGTCEGTCVTCGRECRTIGGFCNTGIGFTCGPRCVAR